MASLLEKAVAKIIKDGKVQTYDMGGQSTSIEVAKAVATYL